MKQKLYCYLSIALLLLPVVWAVGDTFGIVQGSVDFTDEIFFEVYANSELIALSDSIIPQNGAYALTITIPNQYASVEVKPIIAGTGLSQYRLSSGETLRIDIQVLEDTVSEDSQEVNIPLAQPRVSSSSTSSFEFQPQENEKMIQDIASGITDDYEDEITIMPIPQIPSKLKSASRENPINYATETPSKEQPSFLENINLFFLNPIVLLSLAVIACLLIVAIVLKGKRAKYL